MIDTDIDTCTFIWLFVVESENESFSFPSFPQSFFINVEKKTSDPICILINISIEQIQELADLNLHSRRGF